MQRYKDIDHDSGVRGYENAKDSITVWFNGTSRSYKYSYASAGRNHVEQMKRLAAAGDGLHAYINTNVKELYVR